MHGDHPSVNSSRQQEADAGAGPRLPYLRTPLEPLYTAMYGSDEVAARYCGFAHPPAPPRGLWMHGWYPAARPLETPDHLFDVTMSHLHNEDYWVTTERQAAFLKSRGFPHARAIGLPLVYVPPAAVPRENDSLLVMPAHSLPANDRASAKADYVAAISDLRPAFSRICVCINGHDWDMSNWVEEFQTAGFEVIRGAGGTKTLARICALFSQFEYVTTNGFGSLLAYASALGARVSFYGPFSELCCDSLKNIPFFIDNPELMSAEVSWLTEQYCRQTYPEFFCHPADAQLRVEWGRTEIGWQNRVSPEELRQIFGWTPLGRARASAATLAARARKTIPDGATRRLKGLVTREGRRARRELQRLEALTPGEPGVTPVFGAPFAFLDGPAFMEEWDEVFEREAYRFRASSDEPFIVDAGPGVGVSVLYFACLYPRSHIVAVEPDETAHEMLVRNCRTYALARVQVVRGDLLGGVLAGLELPAAHSGARAIDLLKVCLRGSDGERMAALATVLDDVESVAVDHSGSSCEPQNLGPVFDSLQAAGFRVAVQSRDTDRARPLIDIPSTGTREARVRILGFRP